MRSRTRRLLDYAIGCRHQWKLGSVGLSEPPREIVPLSGGLTNESFLVDCGKFPVVVRINGENSSFLGIDRDRERKLLAAMIDLPYVPKVLYSDDEVQVTEFIPGDIVSASQLKDSSIRYTIRSQLDNIQKIILDVEPINYVNYIKDYSDQLDGFPGLEEIHQAAQLLDKSPWHPVIAHHDLIRENVIVNGDEVYFIDWEYAHIGHPLMDYLKLFGAVKGFKESVSQDSADENTDESADAKAEQHGNTEQ
ncbi:phosphotransferase family protein, partial [Porticoccaceae bacterium]|nr:phosphotransferase family protein [Porticoccaceae bacterium]